jgi:dimethylamine/trimethylamine dehydrogenase
MNNELGNIRERMIELGISTVFEQHLIGINQGSAQLASIYQGGGVSSIDCGSLVIVGVRSSHDVLYQELSSDSDKLANASVSSVRSIGDCRAPGAIAHAVYSGHECARTIDAGDSIQPIKWERPSLDSR